MGKRNPCEKIEGLSEKWNVQEKEDDGGGEK
jgi:hypothetical protein